MIRYILFFLFFFPVMVYSQGESIWSKEFLKLENQYHYGKYYQCTNNGKSLLKKVTKKSMHPSLTPVTEALLLKYQAAIGLRLGNDTILDGLLTSWKSQTLNKPDSIQIMGNLALASSAFAFNKYEKAKKLLNLAEKHINPRSDPEDFWIQRIRIAKMELYIITMDYNEAINHIQPTIAYQEKLSNRNIKVKNKKTGEEQDGLLKKKEYKDRLNTLGYLKVLKANIYREKGDFETADSIYSVNHEEMESWKFKNDESFVINEFGFTVLKGLQGNKEAGIELKKIRHKFAQNIKFSIPNIQYNKMYEMELIADLEVLNFSRHTKAIQQYQREVVKNYTPKSTYQFSAKHHLQMADLYKGKYNSYAKHMTKQTNVIRKFYGANDGAQIPFLFDLAEAQEKVYQFKEAEKTLQYIISITEKNNAKTSPLSLKAYLELGAFYSKHTTKFNTADSIFVTHFEKFVSNQLHPFHPLYGKFLGDYAFIDYQRDLFSESMEKYAQLASITKNKYGEFTEEHGIVLEKMARVQLDLGYYPHAEKNLMKSALDFKTAKKTKSINYVYTLQSLGEVFRVNGDYDNANRKYYEAFELAKKYSDIDKMLHIDIDESIAQLYIELGKYGLAEKVLENSIEEKTQNYGYNHIQLIQTNRLFGQLQLHKGQLIDAEKSFNKAIEISKQNFGDSSYVYIKNKSELIEVYYQIGDLNRALNLCSTLIVAYKSKFGGSYLGIADILIQKTKIEYELNYPNKGLLKNLKKASNIITANVGDRHPKIAEVIELRALILLRQGKMKIALIQFQAANLIFTSSFGDKHPKTADNQVKIATLYYESGNYENALSWYKTAQEIYASVFNTRHPKYIYTSSKIGKTKYAQGKYEEAIEDLRNTTTMYLNFIEEKFPSLSTSEKEYYWIKIKEDFDLFNSLAVEYYKQDPSVLVDMYNNQLATKSLLLNSSLKINNRILNYGSPEDLNKLKILRTQQDSLIWAQCYSMDELDSIDYNIQQTKETINKLEKHLSEQADKIPGKFDMEQPSWMDVKNNLLPSEAAMEIIRVKHFNKQLTDSIIYVGLILKKESKTVPEIVVLKNGNDLETKYFSLYQNSIKQRLNDTKSYSEFWEYFDAHLRNKSVIYLSGEGVYNQINPETFKNKRGQYLLTKYTFYNVSNTAEITQKTTPFIYTSKDATLIGNPKFNMNSQVVATPSVALPGAENEVKQLKRYLSEHNWENNLYTGIDATESTVKSLDSPRVLHLATHGYFMENTTIVNNTLFSELHRNQTSTRLLRSGLLLAGADSLLQFNDIKKLNTSDGVLTAMEVMNLNLDRTELVFLSACETGRGDIQAGDGVFGLQQAFMVAGANNVIMTLFKVDDKITQELVQTFYTIWLKTGNKRIAFVNAKKEILNKYKDPIYWGSFVLLGLD